MTMNNISILTPLPQTYQAAPAFELLSQEIESIKKWKL